MTAALLSLAIPMLVGLLLLFRQSVASPWLVITGSLASLAAASVAMLSVIVAGTITIHLGGWEAPLAIRFRLSALTALLLAFTALVHLLVALYAARTWRRHPGMADYWPLSCLLHAALAALWLSVDCT